MYYRNTNAALIVYDVTSKDSFSALRSWVEGMFPKPIKIPLFIVIFLEIRHKVDQPIVMCIIGNKSDMEDRREIKTAAGREYAESVGALFVETSAMTNKGKCFFFFLKGAVPFSFENRYRGCIPSSGHPFSAKSANHRKRCFA